MKDFNPSATAAMVAAIRAVHQRYYDGEKIYEDLYAEIFTNVWYRALIRRPALFFIAARTYYRRLLTAEGLVAGRARFVMDEMLAFVEAYPEHQIVLLGAGYDSYALKKAIQVTCRNIFEVDHPATMNRKLRILDKLRVNPPVRYVPVNFETQDLFTELKKASFRSDLPTFFAWTGNVFYLTKPTVDRTLATISENCTTDAKIAFDYLDPLVLAPNASKTLKNMRKYVARWAEPWINPYTTDDMYALATRTGFKVEKHLDEDEQNAKLFADYPGLHSTEGFRLVALRKMFSSQNS